MTIYSGDLRGPRLSSALSSRADFSLFPPSPHPVPLSNAVPPAPRSAQSSGSLRTPRRGSYRPFFSFLYLIAALFMLGPANKHMNARAFSRTHTAVRSRRTHRRVRTRARARRRRGLSLSLRALSRLINSQRDDISRLFPLDPPFGP